MFKSVCIIVALIAVTTVAASGSHPSLPSRWTSMVQESEVGYVKESYVMVYKPTPENPSAKWTNFTDGSCQRLIYDGGLGKTNMRYLLGCDAVDCCKETQYGNHVEYQVPNVHPEALTSVKYLGKEKIQQYLLGKTIETVCDAYTWVFGPEKFYSFTTTSKANATQLHRWTVHIEGRNFTNEYFDYEGVPADQAKAFSETFAVPDICNHPNTLRCNGAFKQGKLSVKNYEFVMQGLKKYQRGKDDTDTTKDATLRLNKEN